VPPSRHNPIERIRGIRSYTDELNSVSIFYIAISFFSGFCNTCAIQLETCPLCRNTIDSIENESRSRHMSHDSNQQLRLHLISHDRGPPVAETIADDEEIK